jgi:hypothetical protein
VRAHDDLVLAARAIVYRERELPWSELAPAVRGRSLLPVALDPGFELTLDAWSRVVHAPLAVVVLLGDGVPLATTGPDGRARLVASAWPERIRAEAPGHAPLERSAREVLTERALELDGL